MSVCDPGCPERDGPVAARAPPGLAVAVPPSPDAGSVAPVAAQLHLARRGCGGLATGAPHEQVDDLPAVVADEQVDDSGEHPALRDLGPVAAVARDLQNAGQERGSIAQSTVVSGCTRRIPSMIRSSSPPTWDASARNPWCVATSAKVTLEAAARASTT